MATAKKSEEKYHFGVGRRKQSTARAKYYQGLKPLELQVNKKPISTYFSDFYVKTIENACTNIGISTGLVTFFVKGGGTSGQAEACRLALAKALLKSDESFRTILRMHGYLTTDIRKVLPKRTGLRKNRKREQWSKR